MSSSYDLENKPTAQEAIKRLSTGASLNESSTNLAATPKDDKSLKIATFSLQGYLKEKEFATEFLERGGLESLCDIIKNSSGNTLAYALNSFLSLMEHEMGWESLDEEFILRIAQVVVTEQLATIARPATAILLKLVCANEKNTTDQITITCYGYPTIHQIIQKEPSFITTLVNRLLSPEYLLSITSLSLLIAMLKYVTPDYQSELSNMYDQTNLKKNILRLMNNHPSSELKLLILEYQAAYVQNISMRLATPVTLRSSYHMNMLKDIWECAKVNDLEVPGAKKWKRIGFTTEVPQREFNRTGVLGLEDMHYFVLNNQDLYANLILEQIHRPEGKRCPFAKASMEVTDLLCSHWNISSPNTIAEFQPLMLNFNHVHATTLQTFFRIFHDMEATNYDFSKVSALVRSQLRAVLNSASGKDIAEFDRNMFGTPYQQIRDRRLKELEWADDLLGRDAISNLRARLSKQSLEFLKKQRISCLLEGAWFPSPNSNQRMSVMVNNASNPSDNQNTLNSAATNNNMNTGKRWRYYKLNQSKRALMYGDFPEKIAPIIKTYDQLPHRIELSSVSEIRNLRKASTVAVNGNNSHISNNGSDIQIGGQTSFALYNHKQVPLAEFYCSSPIQAAEWKDGFSMIMNNQFTSKETAELFHTLTEVGVKVKLLQIAGDRVEIPHGVVEIPPVPPGLGTGFFYDTLES